MGAANDMLSRLAQLESDSQRHENTTLGARDLAEVSSGNMGLVRSGAMYFGSGDPYDLTTLPHGALIESLGFHLFNSSEIARLGDLNGFLNYVASNYGVGIGSAAAYLTYDPVNGLRIKGTIIIVGAVTNGLDIWDEDITSTFNGVTTSFPTADQYIAGSLQVIENGIWLQAGGNDYSEVTASNFTMIVAPQTGDQLRVNYVRISDNASVYNETPTGTINGTNLVFTPAADYYGSSLMVMLNGITLDSGADYTGGPRKTFNMVVPPVSTDKIILAYLVNSNPKFVFQEVPTGLINGSNTVFSTNNNYVAGTPIVVLNGVKQTITNDYTESSVNQVTFTSAPKTGDKLWITYVSQ